MKKVLFSAFANIIFASQCICGANFFLEAPKTIENIDCSRTIGMT